LFQLFKTFISVYETHNFTRSASTLYLSQPTVSAQIRKLEDELGVSLFIRNGKQEIVPTKEANFLYPRLLKIIEEWEDAIHRINTQSSFRDRCVLASSQSCGAYLIPQLVPALIKEFPMIDFSFPVMSSEDIIENLQKAKADFGLIETPERSEQLSRQMVAIDTLVLAGDFSSKYWLVPEEDSPLANFNENYLNIHNLTPNIIRTNNHEMTLALLKNGVGKTIISKLALENHIPWENLDIENTRNFYFVSRKELISEKLVEISIFIQEQIKKMTN